MIKKFLASTMCCILVALFSSPAIRTTYAQCGCSCAIVCDNRCEFQCSGCGFIEGVSAAVRCCQNAQAAIGDVGPCPDGGWAY